MSEITINHDLLYDKQHQLTLDWYTPVKTSTKTVVIDIHGGGWFRGDKQKDADMATSLASEGYIVLVPNYRLTPTSHFPAPLVDMDILIGWIKHQFEQPKIMVLGSSAGGNMAVEMGIKYGLPSISLSGILDIDSWLNNHPEVIAKPDSQQDFVNSASATINQSGKNDAFYKWFVLNYLDNDLSVTKSATPYYHVNKDTGPMLLVNSLNEFVPTSGVLRLSEQLIKFNIPVQTIFLSGTQHAKGYLDQVWSQILLFLNNNSKE
ncbi:alpha/beta hydrolase [Paucilactobacillus kaifaensis]|uniref:alpha/beta hydrolase n=1 Tax=Paucilactobacillus kaifaensis TaxID=2559921 RepID=UPI0010F69C8C|nr:alpha/beta hydrolase [Paucilactobacillus kaifaensis]